MAGTPRKDPQLAYAALAAPAFEMNPLDLPLMVPSCLPNNPHPLYGTYHFVQSTKTDRATLPVDSPDTKVLSPKTSSASPSTPSSPNSLSPPTTRQASFAAAVLQEDLDTVAALLSAGRPGIAQDEKHAFALKLQGEITVNAVINASGSIALHILAARGNLKGVSLLVESGSILDLPDKAGETPLLKAAYGGHDEVVKYLINHHANVLQRDTDGWTALHNAASRGHLACVSVLLSCGANCNAQSKSGYTPLMNACSQGHIDIVRALISHGANPMLKNAFGDSAYDLASQSEFAFVGELVEQSEYDWLEKSGEKGSKGVLAEYNPIANHTTCIELLHENQRSPGTLFVGTGNERRFSIARAADSRSPWTTPYGKPMTRDDVTLPAGDNTGWFWLTDWKVDTTHPACGVEGWIYARGFEDPESDWKRSSSVVEGAYGVGGVFAGSIVRFRRWVRVRKRRLDVLKGADVFEIDGEILARSVENTRSYYDIARAIVDTSGDGLGGLEKLEQAIQILFSGIKGDTDSARQKAAAELIQTALETAEKLKDRVPTAPEGKQAVAGRRTVRFQGLPDNVENSVVQDVQSFDRMVVKNSRTQTSPPEIENEDASFGRPERVIPLDPFQRVKRVDLKTQSAPPDRDEVVDALVDRSFGERTISPTTSRRTSSASARSVLQRLSSSPTRPPSHNTARRSLSSSPPSTVVPDSTSPPQSPQTQSPPTRTVSWSPTHNSRSRISSWSNSESITRPEDLLEPLEDEIASASGENHDCPSHPIESAESRIANLPESGDDEEIHASPPILEQRSPTPHSPIISDTPPPLPPYPSHLDDQGGTTATSPATQAVDIPNHNDGGHTEPEIDELSITQATPRARIFGGETPRQSIPVGHDESGESSARSVSPLRDQGTTVTPSSVTVADANVRSNIPESRMPSHVGTASATRSTPDSPAINRVAALIQMIPPSPTSPLAGRILSPGPLSYRMTPQSEWQPDDDAPDCTQCARHFNLFLRRHHCRWCGLVYCDRCTGGRVQLVTNDYTPQRVCDSCFHFVTGPNTPLRFSPLITSVPNIPLVVNHVGVAATMGSTSTSIARTLDWGNTAGPSGPNRSQNTAGPRLSQSPPGMLLFGGSRSGVGSSGLFSHDYDDTGNADSDEDDSDEQGGGKGDDESIRTRGSMADSIMNECPVCGTNLDTFAVEEDRAGHVNNCLLRVGVGGGKGQVIKGDRYIVQTLKAEMDETECAICFEDFEIGQRIARLNCLCLYHEHCIEGWFAAQVAKTGVRSCPVHFK